MNPFMIVALVAGGALLYTLTKTAKAALKLEYRIKSVQIRRFKLTQPILLRFNIEFINSEQSKITINKIFLNCDLKFSDNQTKQRLTTLNVTTPIVIDANTSNWITKYFDIEVRWRDLGSVILKTLTSIISGNGVKFPKSCEIKGTITAENIKIPVDQTVAFTQQE